MSGEVAPDSTPWRLLIDGEGAPAWNMAADEAHLRLMTAPVLRIYWWDVPAVSIGYFQPVTVVPAGRPFVRRYTGGGLVDHAADVTYTVVLPRAHAWLALTTAESYARIHEGVASALRALGEPAELTPCCDEVDSNACFEKAVKFDIKVGAKKVAGAAQRRTRSGILQQGSVVLPNPTKTRRKKFAALLPVAMAQTLSFTLIPSERTSEESDLAAELTASRYSTDGWNAGHER